MPVHRLSSWSTAATARPPTGREPYASRPRAATGPSPWTSPDTVRLSGMSAVKTPEELFVIRVNRRSGDRRAQAAVRAAYTARYPGAAFLAC